MDRDKRIVQIEAECRKIERATWRLSGDAYWNADARYKALRKELGRLLVARDREERPHIYRRSA